MKPKSYKAKTKYLKKPTILKEKPQANPLKCKAKSNRTTQKYYRIVTTKNKDQMQKPREEFKRLPDRKSHHQIPKIQTHNLRE